MRTLVVDGATWTVWDTYPASAARLGMHDTELAAGWLTFECAREKRRIVPVPGGWDTWHDDQLRAALRDAAPVSRKSSAPTAGLDP